MTTPTFHLLWQDAVRRFRDRVFLLFRDESGEVTAWSYGEFDEVVARVAGLLRRHGVGSGDAVHVALRNCPAFVALWLAAARLGAWMVPVDPASAARDVASHVHRVRPRLGVCAVARAAVYREGTAKSVPAIVELTEDARDIAPGGPLGEGPEEPEEDVTAPVRPTDRLAVMFTSGTTSTPKGVVLTQANYATVAREMAAAANLHARHRWLVTLPLFHANAQYYCFAPAIRTGASVALTATFSASGWVRQARELRATHASLFAAPIRMILARTDPDEEPLRLQHVWFAQNLGADHYARFAELTGTRPRQLYGMTETIAIVSRDAGENPRHDCIGTPVPGRRIRIATAEGQPEATGELHVLGTPGVDLFAGYLDDEATTGRAFEETAEGTWFATGDLVARDEDDVLRFVGRLDDVIKVAGENVSLTEAEATLAQAPGVLEVAVLGRPDPTRDVVPVAYVVPSDPGNPPGPAMLAAWAADHLVPAARPHEWHLIAELPRTSVGKVRRFQIPSAEGTS
jgi:crotonobetaine/carnitine-CoA ligase